jgi:hypothetical protein
MNECLLPKLGRLVVLYFAGRWHLSGSGFPLKIIPYLPHSFARIIEALD